MTAQIWLIFYKRMEQNDLECHSLGSGAVAHVPTMAQQGAAPDRLQFRSSFLLAALPAAGELGR